jgi:SAM-dependent methyltransferase
VTVSTDNTDPTLLDEQIAYYRARAGEYDEWFYRAGRYDHGAAHTRQWFAEAAEVRGTLHQIAAEIGAAEDTPVASALEFACGTGIWTEELVKIAEHVTAIDAAPEAIAINRAKLRDAGAQDRVTFIEADIFSWEPAQRHDLVFFGFWLSHVPPDRLESFLAAVAHALKPGGRVFMVDSLRSSSGGAQAQQIQPPDEMRQQRQLNDGRTFEVVKIYYKPEILAGHFARAGIAAAVSTTAQFFIYAGGGLASTEG